ncbi:hypothetical protein GCM10009733_068410 [Nonomuraea maheshkhaliensis]|uniref:Uncharacterized protein n=1 Tax=Nonomuraea maheshkhaliensis TaxID=419590 RepID=A0ABN2FXK1_9ACTN
MFRPDGCTAAILGCADVVQIPVLTGGLLSATAGRAVPSAVIAVTEMSVPLKARLST